MNDALDTNQRARVRTIVAIVCLVLVTTASVLTFVALL